MGKVEFKIALMLAFEFGYKAHEKGQNIQEAASEFDKCIEETLKKGVGHENG